MDWTVYAVFTGATPEISDRKTAGSQFAQEVIALNGVVSVDRLAYDATISIEAESILLATQAGFDNVRNAANRAGLPEWPCTYIEVSININ